MERIAIAIKTDNKWEVKFKWELYELLRISSTDPRSIEDTMQDGKRAFQRNNNYNVVWLNKKNQIINILIW